MTEITNTISNKEVNAKVSYYVDKSVFNRMDIIQLTVEAPTASEAEQLFTKKLEELKIKP